jgi:predicted nucleotidyltransferase
VRFFSDSMPSTIDLQPEQLQLVREILHAHVPGREIRAFGSRVLGTAKPTSDLDVCIMGERRVPPAVIERLRSAFSESNLPMKVDLVEWAGLSDGFRAIVERSSTVIQKPRSDIR